MTADKRAALTADLLAETRDEITRADSKANILVVGAGIALTTFLTGLISGQLNPHDSRVVVNVAGITAAVLLSAGAAMLAYAVYPKVGPTEVGRARYFSEVAAHGNVEQLKEALDLEATDREARDRQQLYALSKIVLAKYRSTRRGEVLLGLGLACSALTGILQLGFGR